jgi:hypothetical protein
MVERRVGIVLGESRHHALPGWMQHPRNLAEKRPSRFTTSVWARSFRSAASTA